MADSILEKAAANLEALIDTITTANGYNDNHRAIRSRRVDYSDINPLDGDVIIKQGQSVAVAGGIGVQDWTTTVELAAIVTDAESATAAIDIRRNRVVGDIIKAILIDTTRGYNIFLSKGLFQCSSHLIRFY